MKRSAKTWLRILFGFVAALSLFGWVQGVLLVVDGDISDALWWLVGALVLAVDIVRRRRTLLILNPMIKRTKKGLESGRASRRASEL